MKQIELKNLQMTSREIAELTGKEHKHVLRDTRQMLDELGESKSGLGSTYLDTQGQERPEYRLNKELTLVLVTGYSTPLRQAVVNRWMYLEEENARLKASEQARLLMRQEAKTGYLPLTMAIAEDHQVPQFYHYSNEANLINRIVLGKTAKKFKEEHEVEHLRDVLSEQELSDITWMQQSLVTMIEMGMEYEARKANLISMYERRSDRRLTQ